jgi:hypothetical protein
MSALVLTGDLMIGGLDVSDECTMFQITAKVDTITVPATLNGIEHGRGGAADYQIEIHYLSNDLAGSTFRKLWENLGGTLTFSGKMRSAAIGPTNPEWHGSFVVTEATLGAESQKLSEGSATFPMTGPPIRATS